MFLTAEPYYATCFNCRIRRMLHIVSKCRTINILHVFHNSRIICMIHVFLKYGIIHMTLVCNMLLHVVSNCYTFTSFTIFSFGRSSLYFLVLFGGSSSQVTASNVQTRTPVAYIFSVSFSRTGQRNDCASYRRTYKKLFSSPDLLWCPFSLSLNEYKFHFPSRLNMTTHLHLAAKLRMTNAITA
jgi:hypothetical protein